MHGQISREHSINYAIASSSVWFSFLFARIFALCSFFFRLTSEQWQFVNKYHLLNTHIKILSSKNSENIRLINWNVNLFTNYNDDQVEYNGHTMQSKRFLNLQRKTKHQISIFLCINNLIAHLRNIWKRLQNYARKKNRFVAKNRRDQAWGVIFPMFSS